MASRAGRQAGRRAWVDGMRRLFFSFFFFFLFPFFLFPPSPVGCHCDLKDLVDLGEEKRRCVRSTSTLKVACRQVAASHISPVVGSHESLRVAALLCCSFQASSLTTEVL